MTIFRQDSTQYKVYFGWYGLCGQTDPNKTYNLRSASAIAAVYRTTTTRLENYSETAPDFINSLTTLETGNCYWVVVKPGTSSFTIEDFRLSDIQLEDTPTEPTLLSECDSLLNNTSAILKQDSNQYKVYMGWYGVCKESASNDSFDLRSDDKIAAVYRATKTRLENYESTAPDFINSLKTLEVGNCYWITLKPGTSEVHIDGFRLASAQMEQPPSSPVMIANCESLRITPTPTQTPTPPPQPTPTPIPIKKLQFRWADINGREILQVKNVIKPTHSNFQNRDTEENWSTLYAFKFNQAAYSLDHQTWPDAAVPLEYEGDFGMPEFGDLQFDLGSFETEDGVEYYQLLLSDHASHTEYLPSSSLSQPAHLFIYAGDNNDPDNSALSTDSNWPVIAKKEIQVATPTPIPTDDEPEKILKVPTILIGWQTGTPDESYYFQKEPIFFGATKRLQNLADITDMLNGENYHHPNASEAERPSGSVQTYYSNWTRGKLKIEFVILPAGTNSSPNSNNPDDYAYLDNRRFSDYGVNLDNNRNKTLWKQSGGLVDRATSQAIRNYGVTKFNKDFPGATFNIITAGYGNATSQSNFAQSGPWVWPHKSDFFSSALFREKSYQVNPQLQIRSGNWKSSQSPLTGYPEPIGVYAHETGHVFGPMDLYGSYKAALSTSPAGLGSLNMMASGSHGVEGNKWTPGYPNGWTRYGMMKELEINVDRLEITENTTDIEIFPFAEDTKSICVFAPNNDKDVWWIDYRTSESTGYKNKNYDSSIAESGLLITHQTAGRNFGVKDINTRYFNDPDMSFPYFGAGNNSAASPVPRNPRGEVGHFISHEQKDGKYQRNFGRSFAGRYLSRNDLYTPGDEFSPYTMPSSVCWDGTLSGVKIHNIRKTDHGSMLFDVEFISEPSQKILRIEYPNVHEPAIDYGWRAHRPDRGIDGAPAEKLHGGKRIPKNTSWVKIITENVPDGSQISMTNPFGMNNTGTVNNNECMINLNSNNFINKTRSSLSQGTHISYKVEGSSAFAYNDLIIWV
jgi:M6 family metalloprotease-like protein